MKKSTCFTALFYSLLLFGVASAQTSGVLWIKTFQPGSTNLNDASIDKEALAALDELMKTPNIDVTFLGAADSIAWVMNGRSVHTHISEAWNDAKRLGRARAMRARYERGNVGVTHESIAGVKVVWSKKVSVEDYERDLTKLKEDNEALNYKLAQLETDVEQLRPSAGSTTTSSPVAGNYKVSQSYFDWFLQGGMWAWQSGSGGDIISPSIALGIIINKTSFIIQGGVTPWTISTPDGNLSESFVYLGLKHMKSKKFGFSGGIFRGWEFFTATDDWSFKTTGISAGLVAKYSIFECNPMLSYTNSNSIFGPSNWKFGTTLGLSINVNEAF